jgi:predicted permease
MALHHLRAVLSRLRGLVTPLPDADVDDELREHLRLLEEDFVARGLAEPDARRAAARALGGVAKARGAINDQWTWGVAQRLLQDLRWTARSLRRAPTFTVSAVTTLALAICSVTAVVSLAAGTLYRPLPYPDESRIVSLASGGRSHFTGTEYHGLKDRLTSPEALAVDSGARGYNLLLGMRSHHVSGRRVSPEWFAVLGTPALVGRTFLPGVDHPADPVVVLSHRLWRQHFAADPAIVGTSVALGDRSHQVIGVMPESFESFPDADLFIPAEVSPQNRGRNHMILARIGRGVAMTQAQAELTVVSQGLAGELGLPAAFVREVRWVRYRDALGLTHRPLIVLVGAAVCVLLLIATVNVAGLQLVRVTARAPELATRAALGGSPKRLLVEALVEAVVIGSLGGLVGLGTFVLMRTSLVDLLPPAWGASLALDYRVVGATGGVVLVVAVAIGMLPALRARGVNLHAAITHGVRTSASRSTLRWRRGFAATQVALAVLLLTSASLVGRTLLEYARVDLGFTPDNLVVGTMSLSGVPRPAGMPAPEFIESTLHRLRASPGVASASVTSGIPVARALNLPLLPPPGSQVTEIRSVDWRYVATGFFEALDVRPLDGRLLDQRDHAGSQRVALVNVALATAYFGNASAVGKVLRLATGPAEAGADEVTIVGVVKDFKAASGAGWTRGGNALTNPATPSIFVPLAQAPESLVQGLGVQWLVRYSGNPSLAERVVTSIVNSAEPRLPFVRFQTMEEVVAEQASLQRMLFLALGTFGAAALLLAGVGTYGVMAYSVAARSRELGVRLALGASPISVVRLVLAEGGVLVGIGATVGVLCALAASAGLRSFIWGIAPLDGVSILGTVALMALVALIAMAGPAVHAARLPVSSTLRAP